jgi:hypothetical protein
MTFVSFGKDAAAEEISCKMVCVGNVTSDPESVPLSPAQVSFLGPSTLTVSGTSLEPAISRLPFPEETPTPVSRSANSLPERSSVLQVDQ